MHEIIDLDSITVMNDWTEYQTKAWKTKPDPVTELESQRAFYGGYMASMVAMGRIGMSAESDEEAAVKTDSLMDEIKAEIPNIRKSWLALAERVQEKMRRKVGKLK